MAPFDDSDFTEAEYQESFRILNLHIFEKTLQIGAVAGALVGFPLHFFRRHRPNANLARTLGRSSLFGTVVAALVLNPVIYYGKTSKLDRVGIYDRGYRLRYNKGQLRTDRYSVIGAGAGLVFGYVAGGGVVGALQAASLGIAAGVGTHVAQQAIEGKKA